MNRLDICKNRISDSRQSNGEKRDMELLYQELINYLPTYKEKKELSEYYAKIKKQLVLQ